MKHLSCLIFICIVLSLSVLAFKKNLAWADGIAAWKDAVKKSPYKARPYNNLGSALNEAGRIDEAAANYKRAVEIDPYHYQYRTNLGYTYMDKKLFEQALGEFYEAKKLAYYYFRQPALMAESRNNLGNIRYITDSLDEAVSEYKEAIRLNPAAAEPHFNLAGVYSRQGRLEDAANELKAGIAINPYDEKAMKEFLRIKPF